MRPRYLIPVSLTLLAIGGWWLSPHIAVWSMALATKKGEESSQAARDRIVFFGERAIQPTIASIEKHSPWVRRYCYLPSALQKIGGTAHADLLAAITAQADPTKRAYLISALQSAFDDYSRFATVIDDFEAGRLQDWGLSQMSSGIRHRFPNAPALLTEDRKLNPDFKTFWRQLGEPDDAGRATLLPR